jgi:hypothetical protein
MSYDDKDTKVVVVVVVERNVVGCLLSAFNWSLTPNLPYGTK